MNTSHKIPTLAGILIILASLILGVSLIQEKRQVGLHAKEAAAPNEVRVSNVESGSLTVNWTTDGKTRGYLLWGKDTSTAKISLNKVIKRSYNHSIDLINLDPDTEYFFRIVSEGSVFENNLIPWETRTAYKIPYDPPSNIISGVVEDKNGLGVGNAIVYVTVGGGNLLSTSTTVNGSFLVDIARAKNSALDSYVEIDEENTLLDLYVQGGPLGISSVKAYPNLSKPLDKIILGSVHDFRKEMENSDLIPEALIKI